MRLVKPTILFLLFFILWILVISSLWTNPALLTIILIIISAAYFLLFKERKGQYYFLAGAIFGPVGEALVSATGLWTYHGEAILGIPYWLPLAWGITAVALQKYLIHINFQSKKLKRRWKLMTLSLTNLSPLASLVFGILILIFPKFLNYLIAAYLIIVGLLGLGILR